MSAPLCSLRVFRIGWTRYPNPLDTPPAVGHTKAFEAASAALARSASLAASCRCCAATSESRCASRSIASAVASSSACRSATAVRAARASPTAGPSGSTASPCLVTRVSLRLVCTPRSPATGTGAPTASGRGTAATEVAAPRPTTPTLATTAAANPRLDSAPTVGRRCAAGAARRGPAPGKGPGGRSPADRLGVMATARTARYVTRIDSSLWKTPCGSTTRPRLQTKGSTPASGRTRA